MEKIKSTLRENNQTENTFSDELGSYNGLDF